MDYLFIFTNFNTSRLSLTKIQLCHTTTTISGRGSERLIFKTTSIFRTKEHIFRAQSKSVCDKVHVSPMHNFPCISSYWSPPHTCSVTPYLATTVSCNSPCISLHISLQLQIAVEQQSIWKILYLFSSCFSLIAPTPTLISQYSPPQASLTYT